MFLYTFFLSLLSSFSVPAALIDAPAPTEPSAVYISTNKGKSWVGFAEGLPESVSVMNVYEHKGKIYLTAIGDGVFVLEAGSNTWQRRNNGLPVKVESRAIPLAGDMGFDFFPTSIAANGDRLILGTFNNGAYYSDDAGESWQQAKTNIDDVVGSLLFTDDKLIAGTHQGIWQSNDRGITWQLLCETGFRINALAMHNGKLHVARQNGMGILTDNDIDWSDLKTDWAIFQLLKQEGYLYATTAKGEVFRTKTGKLWESNRFAVKGIPATTVPDALWNGINPKLPVDRPAGKMTETSRGWIVGVGGGC